jgi:hypothetical protein
MLGLGVPIGLEYNFCQATAARVRVAASLSGEGGKEGEDVEKTLAHVHESVSESETVSISRGLLRAAA